MHCDVRKHHGVNGVGNVHVSYCGIPHAFKRNPSRPTTKLTCPRSPRHECIFYVGTMGSNDCRHFSGCFDCGGRTDCHHYMGLWLSGLIVGWVNHLRSEIKTGWAFDCQCSTMSRPSSHKLLPLYWCSARTSSLSMCEYANRANRLCAIVVQSSKRLLVIQP